MRRLLQRVGQRAWQASREQAGIDGAGDCRVVLHLGHHGRAQGALDVACVQRPAWFADQHDAGGLHAVATARRSAR
jgi:hypothetical protein